MQTKLISKSKAMTFAELALTLLIIGVVFAVTVPGLKKTKERSQMETGLKKAYSTINQAVDRALSATDVDYARSNLETTIPDSMDQWDFTNNDKFMDTYLRPFLSIQRDCSTSDPQCFGASYRKLDGTAEGSIYTYAKSVLLNDGMAMQVHGCNGNICDVHVDLNGPNEPNVCGVDYWEFTINKARGLVLPNDEGGDYSTQEVFDNGWKITKW